MMDASPYLGEALAGTLGSLVLATTLDVDQGSLDAVNPLASLETLGNGLLETSRSTNPK